MLRYFLREDRRTCSKGQFYSYRRPDNILWFQRIRERMGFARDDSVEELSAGESSATRRMSPAESGSHIDGKRANRTGGEVPLAEGDFGPVNVHYR